MHAACESGMRSAQQDPEDQEGDIADDPLTSAVHDDIGGVLKRTDNRLLVWLAVVGVLVLLLDNSALKGTWTNVASILALVGAISLTIYGAFRGRRKVASEYGLTCPNCGYTPMPQEIMSAAMVQ